VAILRDIQAMWIWVPVAKNSLLSLWPQVKAETGAWNDISFDYMRHRGVGGGVVTRRFYVPRMSDPEEIQ
jgi:hypothetical protein